MKPYNDDIPVIAIDGNFEIVHLNAQAVKEYGEVEGKKCYSVFNKFDRPCYEATQYTCPIKILKDINSSSYTGVYTLSVKPDKYVVISVEKDGKLFIQKHRILDRNQLELFDFKKIFDFLSEGLVLIDRKNRKVKLINSQFLKIFEVKEPEENFIDKDISLLDRAMPDELKGALYREEKIPDYQEFISHFRGRYLVIRKVSIEGRYVLWSFEEKKETDLSDEIFRVLLEMTPVGIFLQCNGRFMYVNPTLAHILETVPGELIGSSVFNFIHPDDREKVARIVEKRKRGERFKTKYVVRVITGNGNLRWVEITSDTIYFRGKSCGIGSCVDVTEMKELEDNLRKLATIDQLTGIYNRYSFEKFLEEEIYKSERYGNLFALIMFDIDNFKQINDQYGHQIGDGVLKELVQIVKNSIRKSDILGRWGGEEFMVLVPIKEKEDAIKIAEKIRKKVENHRFKNVGGITISLGVSFFRKGDTIKSLIRRADTALYEAKKAGKNRTIIAD